MMFFLGVFAWLAIGFITHVMVCTFQTDQSRGREDPIVLLAPALILGPAGPVLLLAGGLFLLLARLSSRLARSLRKVFRR